MGQAKWAFILIVGLLLFPPAAQSKDTSMRCGTDLIDIGNSKSRVAYLCGQPFSKEIIGQTKVADNKSGIEFIVERWTYDTSVVERWTYDTSVGYFTILTFKGDRLVRLEDERKW
jgi:hypothetical protein